ncbi:MAG: hypothetical protein Q7R78_01395, partial [bacterium]|nr:hypothetical protein [bacterium]
MTTNTEENKNIVVASTEPKKETTKGVLNPALSLSNPSAPGFSKNPRGGGGARRGGPGGGRRGDRRDSNVRVKPECDTKVILVRRVTR